MIGTTAARVIAGLLAVLLVIGAIAYLVQPAGGAPAGPVGAAPTAVCAVRAAEVPGAAE